MDSVVLNKLMILAVTFYMSIVTSHYYDGVEGARRSFSKVKDDEHSKLLQDLKILNKPFIKTIQVYSPFCWRRIQSQTEEGDIFDCVDIHKQPAFDHHFLKNHKIQMIQSSFREGFDRETHSSPSISSLESPSKSIRLTKLGCPEGTVPIRRVEMEDLKRAKYVFSSKSNFHLLNGDIPGEQRAIVRTKLDSGQIYYGIQGSMSIYSPDVGHDQSSSSQIFIEGGSNGQFNTLQTGWMVQPKLFNDTRARMFGYWRVDEEMSTGCYNTLCPGFIQVDKDYTFGDAIAPVSTYGGDQFDLKVTINQDKDSGNWWVSIMDEDIKIGYWPKELLPSLVDGSPRIGWGGKAVGTSSSSPQMGSGHFPDGDHFGHSSYMRQMKVFVRGHVWEDPNRHIMESIVDNGNCYGLEYDGNAKGEYQHFVQFGGPGGNCGA